jgi:hypothetical protein
MRDVEKESNGEMIAVLDLTERGNGREGKQRSESGGKETERSLTASRRARSGDAPASSNGR